MRIAFIGQKGVPVKFGGIERHTEDLAIQLVKGGHQVFIYCRPWYTSQEQKKFQGVNLISLPSIHTKHLDAISHTFLATIHALFSDYDIIHYHGVGPALLSFLPRIFKPQTKVVVTFHCIDRKHQKWGWFARLVLKLGEMASCYFPHQTITVSKTLQYYCSQIYNKDVIYIPSGVIAKDANYRGDLIQEKFGLVQDNYILAVSRLVRHKGIHYLISAYQKLKTDKKLVIVGGSAFTDDYIEKLKKIAEDNSNIIFTGYQSGETLDQLFANAYLVVHSSESEGLPLTILEAMSYGRAVLASDITEHLEIVKGQGFVFKNKNIDDLADKLRYLFDQSETVNRVGESSREYVRQNYNWDDIAIKVNKIYQELLKDKKNSPVLAEQKF